MGLGRGDRNHGVASAGAALGSVSPTVSSHPVGLVLKLPLTSEAQDDETDYVTDLRRDRLQITVRAQTSIPDPTPSRSLTSTKVCFLAELPVATAETQ